MIARNTPEWSNLLNNLKLSKLRGRGEILCIRCWRVYSHDDKILHKFEKPDHKKYFHSMTHYGNEHSFVQLALRHGKVKVHESIQHFDDPFVDHFPAKKLIDQEETKSRVDSRKYRSSSHSNQPTKNRRDLFTLEKTIQKEVNHLKDEAEKLRNEIANLELENKNLKTLFYY